MDVLSGLSNALRISWTVPIKITGSLVGTLIAVGAMARLAPLQTLSVVSRWLGLPGQVSATFSTAHGWIVDRSVVFAWVGCVVFCLFLAISGYRDADRAAPVALVGAGLALESGSIVPLVVLGGALVLAAALAITARVGNANIYSPADSSAEWVGRSVGRALLATLYWVIAPLSWVVRAGERNWI
jgi:hypothetical protein